MFLKLEMHQQTIVFRVLTHNLQFAATGSMRLHVPWLLPTCFLSEQYQPNITPITGKLKLPLKFQRFREKEKDLSWSNLYSTNSTQPELPKMGKDAPIELTVIISANPHIENYRIDIQVV